MNMASTPLHKIIPAHLSFLAIYSPNLGTSDETFRDQVVFYHDANATSRRRKLQNSRAPAEDVERELREEENEKLRQIGLAQGLVGFAKSFSGGENVDSVETEKSRIIMGELEKGWWILASVDLTRLPKVDLAGTASSAKAAESLGQQWEYSSREVSPPALLLQQLYSAHRIFLLHHGPSLQDLYARLSRQKFCSTLERFWSRFLHNWDVLLHGNPAVDIFAGMKLAAGGELGIGVGEEEWGSGEREVLEGFISRTEGLVDLVVSRFGEPSKEQEEKRSLPLPPLKSQKKEAPQPPWMGVGDHPTAADGMFFGGIGSISKKSLKDVVTWMEWIYKYGDHAYGVKDNPTSDRRKRRKKAKSSNQSRPPGPRRRTLSKNILSPEREVSPGHRSHSPRIPPPIVAAVEASLESASTAAEASNSTSQDSTQTQSRSAMTDPDVWMKYLTLGYSSGGWSANKKTSEPSGSDSKEMHDPMEGPVDEAPELQHVDPEPEIDKEASFEERMRFQVKQENQGHFVIGLQADLEAEDNDGDGEDGEGMDEDEGSRTLLRTLHVEVLDSSSNNDSNRTLNLQSSSSSSQRLRVIVFVHRPFIYTFLFNSRTPALNLPSFYHHLYTYLAPLHRPLSASTSPARVAAKLASAHYSQNTATPTQEKSLQRDEMPIYDFIYDPISLTIHSTIPYIPEPGTAHAEGLSSISASPLAPPWTRVEALSVHSQILATVVNTRKSYVEVERTAKTSRGWWVVWLRLQPSQPTPVKAQSPGEAEEEGFAVSHLREAFLVRRARDVLPGNKNSGKGSSSFWRLGSAGDVTGGAAVGWGPARLAEGIGVDARRYVEGLLSLNR